MRFGARRLAALALVLLGVCQGPYCFVLGVPPAPMALERGRAECLSLGMVRSAWSSYAEHFVQGLHCAVFNDCRRREC